MKVSVVMACLNAADTVERAVESVLSQGRYLAELVVVDGGSVDGTVRAVERLAVGSSARIDWSSGPDGGIYDALNIGIRRATGDYIVILGADDALLPDALQEVARAAESLDGAHLIYGDAILLEPGGRRSLMLAVDEPRTTARVPRAMPVCHQAMAFSSRAYLALGPYDDRFKIAADYEFFLRFYESGMLSQRLDAPLVVYNLSGVSSRSGFRTADEYRRVQIAHGVPRIRAGARMASALAASTTMRVIRWLDFKKGMSE